MCDKLTIECAGCEYERVWIGRDVDEAIEILSYRINLSRGDIIELTDGTRAVVIDNDRREKIITFVTPLFGEKYEYGCNQFMAPYNVVKYNCGGEAVDFEDVIRVEGPGIVHKLIEREAWQEAADMLDDLRSISVSVEEFSPYLSRIYAGIEKDEEDKKDASKRFGELLEMMRRES